MTNGWDALEALGFFAFLAIVVLAMFTNFFECLALRHAEKKRRPSPERE